MLRKQIRDMIREELMDAGEITEYDALFSKKADWEAAKDKLRNDLQSLLYKIENDDYSSGMEEISDVIVQLKRWKKTMEKHLNDGVYEI